MKHMPDVELSTALRWFVIIAALLIGVGCCVGCDYAWIHKRQIHEFQTHFRAYRSFVEIKAEFEEKAALIEEGVENMDKTLDAWKGDWKP